MTTTWKILGAAALAAALFALGRCSVGTEPVEPAEGFATDAEEAAAEPAVWTCPMHPQIRLPRFGDCPICSMDLVPLEAGGESDPRRLAMSPAAKELAGVVTAPVERRFVTRPVRMVGKVELDETAVKTISAWVPGRLDRLYVDYTGVRVSAGDHLVRLYSPELSTAQEELLSARERLTATAGEASEFLAESNRRAYRAAREKLLLWGLTEAQVDAAEARGTAEDHVTITSPVSGIVLEKKLDEGAYVQTGTPVYTIADLSHLWVQLDAYEQDLPWLAYGQAVVLEAEGLPGELLEGRVSFIDPVVHERTRTAKVRVNVDNPGGRLKPGMFVRAVVSARLGTGGVVLDRGLAGKWVSPMHPEIVKDAPGTCDVCGMDLVPAEELGLVGATGADAQRPLVVPASAVLVTGRRAVVYVEVPDAERPTYEGRVVRLGPRAGDEYVVLAGLAAGERVVVQGAFRIDSSMQIRAQPSMMSMPGERAPLAGPEGRLFRAELRPVYAAYLALGAALAADDEPAARAALAELRSAVRAVSAAGLPAVHRTVWEEERALLAGALGRAGDAADLAALRDAFEDLSTAALALERAFGHAAAETRHEVHCPMAFDDAGAVWLQAGEEVANPYFGASMLACGELREAFPPTGAAEPAPGGAAAGAHAGHDHGADGADSAAEPGGPVELGAERSPLAGVFAAYVAAQRALAADDAPRARRELGALAAAAAAAEEAEPPVAEPLAELARALEPVADAADVEALRAAFRAASEALLAIEARVGNPLAVDLVVVHCPMAFDFEGADWLQVEGTVANPYFGASMLRCGSVSRVAEAH